MNKDKRLVFNKRIAIVFTFCMLVSFLGGIIFTKQAKNLGKYTLETPLYFNEEDINAQSLTWLTGYLIEHQKSLNLNNRIQSFRIDLFEFEERRELIYSYRVKLTVYTNKNINGLFETEGVKENGKVTYDMILNLETGFDSLKYSSDSSYAEFSKNQIDKQYEGDLEENVDLLKGLYRTINKFLEVRESLEGEWVQTPVLSKDFDSKSQGWYQNDQRIYVENNRILILVNSENIDIVSSQDSGDTWNTQTLISDQELSALSRGYIGFTRNHGFITVLSHVALNSDVMTIFESVDGGVNWIKGETPNVNVYTYSSSVIDNVLYFTNEDSPKLFSTRDRGKNYDVKEIRDLSSEPKLEDTSLNWEEIFVQAEAPFIEGGNYVVFINQGQNGDYKNNIRAKYISVDKGITWKFQKFEEAKPIETVN